MKRLNCIIIISVPLWLFFSSVLFAAEIKWLKEIYNTSIPCEIRRNFDLHLHTQQACPEAKLLILDGEKFRDIYDNKFLVIGLQPNSFGGLWATILVKDNKLRVFRLWLYDINKNEYDLRSITELFGHFDEEGTRQLTSTVYSRFWM